MANPVLGDPYAFCGDRTYSYTYLEHTSFDKLKTLTSYQNMVSVTSSGLMSFLPLYRE